MRFGFPEGFHTNKIFCKVWGTAVEKTEVLPDKRSVMCLNIPIPIVNYQ